MRVSAVIATYNAADYLRQAIESVLAQTHQPVEIVVVDDGSTDHTRKVCDCYGPRVKYFRQPRDSQSFGASAQLRGILESTGEFVAFLDHDDRWLPTKIEKQLKALDAHPEVGAVFTAVQPIDSQGQPSGEPFTKPPSGDAFHSLLVDSCYFPSAAMVRRAALARCGLHDVDALGFDWEQWLLISRHYHLLVLDECLTEYRVHPGNTSQKKIKLYSDIRLVLERQGEWLHPNCDECRTYRRKGRSVWARKCLERYRAIARDGKISIAPDGLAGTPQDQVLDLTPGEQLSNAFAFLRLAFLFSPREVLRPRQLLSITKSAALAGFSRVGLRGSKS